MGRFDGKAVLVTGAASGIGRAVAQAFAAQGARLALADLNPDGLKAVARDLGAVALSHDAMIPGNGAQMVTDAVDNLGGLDALINVAGAYHRAHFADLAASDWDRMLRINLTGVFELCQAALPALTRSKGAIVNTTSTAGIGGIAYAAAYAASKGGVIALTKSLAAELAHLGIRVNAVAPGRVKTAISAGLTPLQGARPELSVHRAKLAGMEEGAAPEDLTGAYLWLAGKDAAYVSGQVIVADGAWSVG
ncbi:SDR family oxidoreductase [Pseudorhodobacter sp.]|uniref:SDR family NAD(P)-dependent oxidoreductase n=1 Tax=Pseudorhodobacter sp. TaxID=1934400 RepID=UPI002AFF8E5C|nr:SDR family oxidoreductase [Pseudorhodobacter sp.]